MDEPLEFPPPNNPNESQRIDELEALGLAGEQPFEAAERLVQRAGTTTDAPAAWFCVIDEDTRWFKSCVGFQTARTARRDALCAYTIAADDVLTVQDVSDHPFFATRGDFGEQPVEFRAYCGVPVRGGSRHHPIGTLAVADNTARPFEPPHRQTLGLLRDELELKVANHRLRVQLGEQARQIDDYAGEHTEMFHRMRSRLIDVAGAINSDAGFIQRLADRLEVQEAARDVVTSSEFIDDILQMAEGYVTYTGGRLELIASKLHELAERGR